MHNNKAGKLDSKAVECVFLGVDDLKKGFRLLRLHDRSVCISRDVVFDESVFPLLDDSADAQERRHANTDDQSVTVVISPTSSPGGGTSGGVSSAVSSSVPPAGVPRSLRVDRRPSGHS